MNLYAYCGGSAPSHFDPDGADYYPNDDGNHVFQSNLTDAASDLKWGGMVLVHGADDLQNGVDALANMFTLGLYGLIEDSICVGQEYGGLAGVGYGAGSLVGVTQALELIYNVDILTGQSLDSNGRASRAFDIGLRLALFVKAARTPANTYGGCCALDDGAQPKIKPGSAGGPTAGKGFSAQTKAAAYAQNPTRTCVYCRRPGTATHVDHVIPKALGGNATLDNAQLSCPHCNFSKGVGKVPKTPPTGFKGSWPPNWFPR